MIVRPSETSIGHPYIGSTPVIYGIGIVHVVGNLARPFEAFVTTIVLFTMNGPPTVETFLRADSHETTRATGSFIMVQPLGKLYLEIIVPQIIGEEIEVFFAECRSGHLPHPKFFLRFVPRAPITLMHRCACGNLERDTHSVNIQNIGILRQNFFHISQRCRILYLIIHVKNTQSAFQFMFPDIIDAKIQQHPAVLPSRERNIYIVEIGKNFL